MKWAYGIRRKISAALLLSAIFVLLFVKNMLDNKNVAQLGTSFSSVYEDRLLVESYIYRMSEHLFRKRIMIDSAATRVSALEIMPLIAKYNEAIKTMLTAYENTRLTEAETIHFENFKANVRTLTELEDTYFQLMARGGKAEAAKNILNAQFNQASRNLDLLSGIQISEGKLLNEHSQKIVAGSSILTQFEIGILVAVALMIFVLVFESTTVFSKTVGNQSLN
jgi:hypothetical protein